MARVELQRARIVLEGERHLAEVAVGVAQIILDVSVARITQRRGRQQPYCALPVLPLDRLPPTNVLGIAGAVVVAWVGERGQGAGQQQRQRCPAQQPAHFAMARYCFSSTISGRSPSASRVSPARCL